MNIHAHELLLDCSFMASIRNAHACLLASGTTGSDGTFSIEWTAKATDWWDNTAEVYAKFEEDDIYESSKSSQYTITVS